MKRNPWQEDEKERREEEIPIAYSDGTVVKVWLRELSIPEATAAGKKGEEYTAAFAGFDEQGNQRAFAPPVGAPIPLTDTFCESAATIEAMQSKLVSISTDGEATPEDPYTFGDLVGMAMRMKDEYVKLANAAARVQAGGAALRPPAADAGQSSVPHSTIIKHTPPRAGKSGGASGASTNGSEASTGDSEPSSATTAPMTRARTKRGRGSRSPATAT